MSVRSGVTIELREFLRSDVHRILKFCCHGKRIFMILVALNVDDAKYIPFCLIDGKPVGRQGTAY